MEPLLASPSAVLLVAALVLYLAAGAVRRLYLSPIAAFPGPRLAALTFWYEFYYDVVRKGRYTWEIQRMHDQYGPIVRINPHELHVNDPDFYDEIYVGPARRTHKWAWSANMFGTSQAAVGTTDHDLHRLRRSALNPFFSKRSVARLEPVIQANVDRLCQRLADSSGTGQPVNLSDAFTCLAADVIGSYAFGQSYGFLETPDFHPGWRRLMTDLSRGSHLMKQFNWAYTLLTFVPERLVSVLHPLTKELFKLQSDISAQIRSIIRSRGGSSSSSSSSTRPEADEKRLSSSHPTIFHDLLSSKLPPSELSVPRLTEEAVTLVGAGTVTTAHTLTTIQYHLLANPAKSARLRAELAAAHARAGAGRPRWQQLEQLPYLCAVVAEGLRMSYGVSHRLQRVAPDTALRYARADGRAPAAAVIPAGTPVSMTQMFLHDSPALFPAPAAFAPERWLPLAPAEDAADDAAAARRRDPAELRRFLVPFSRGTRQCVGMNLAYAELFLALGRLWAPAGRGGLEMRLWETDRADVDVAHDFFNPCPRLGSVGVRAVVL